MLLLVFASVVVLNVKATYVLVRSSSYSQKQKLIQLSLVWGLPIVGAILVLFLATETTGPKITTDLQDRAGYDDGQMRPDHATFDGGGDGGGGD